MSATQLRWTRWPSRLSNCHGGEPFVWEICIYFCSQTDRFKDYGPRKMDHGKWTMDNGPRTTDHGPRTTDNGPRTTDRFVWEQKSDTRHNYVNTYSTVTLQFVYDDNLKLCLFRGRIVNFELLLINRCSFIGLVSQNPFIHSFIHPYNVHVSFTIHALSIRIHGKFIHSSNPLNQLTQLDGYMDGWINRTDLMNLLPLRQFDWLKITSVYRCANVVFMVVYHLRMSYLKLSFIISGFI